MTLLSNKTFKTSQRFSSQDKCEARFCLFDTCVSASNGGALSLNSVQNIDINYSLFAHCSSNSFGGAIFCAGASSCVLDFTHIDSCSSINSGPAFYLTSSLYNFQNDVLLANNKQSYTVSLSGSGSSNLSNLNQTLTDSGSLSCFTNQSPTVDMKFSTFVRNLRQPYGCFVAYAPFNVTSSNFIGNDGNYLGYTSNNGQFLFLHCCFLSQSFAKYSEKTLTIDCYFNEIGRTNGNIEHLCMFTHKSEVIVHTIMPLIFGLSIYQLI